MNENKDSNLKELSGRWCLVGTDEMLVEMLVDWVKLPEKHKQNLFLIRETFEIFYNSSQSEHPHFSVSSKSLDKKAFGWEQNFFVAACFHTEFLAI